MAYPVRTVVRPAALAGKTNGQLPASILTATPGQAAGPSVVLVAAAGRAWKALAAAASAAGHTLKATSLPDSYRPYAIQERIFIQRYQLEPIAGANRKWWRNSWWYLKPGNATAAVPGTSNHGWGLAVDTGEERDGDAGTESIDAKTLAWLLANEESFGWSHEIQSEPWHIRYWAGDAIPAAVLAYEEDNDMAAFTEAHANAITDLLQIATGLANGVDQVPVHDKDGKLSLLPFYARVAAEVAKLPAPAAEVDVAAVAKAVNDDAAARLAD